MNIHLCGVPLHMGFPQTEPGGCCMGEATQGPDHCTCWVPVYERDQEKPDEKAVPGTRTEQCEDCAYRADSPERQGDEEVDGTPELLERIVVEGQPFWCHQGIRRPLLWKHPSGMTVDGSASDYKPPIVDGVPYQADGRPADICAGWSARRAAYLRENVHA